MNLISPSAAQATRGDVNFLLVALLLSGVYFESSQRLYLGEILATLLACKMIIQTWASKRQLFESGLERKLFRFFILWIFANTVSSFFSFKSLQSAFIGVIIPSLSVLLYSSILFCIRNQKQAIKERILIFYAVGGIIGYVIQPERFALEYAWKFGFGIYVSIIVFVILGKVKQRLFIFLLSVPLALYSFDQTARSLGGVILLASMSLILIKSQKRELGAVQKKRNIGHSFRLLAFVSAISVLSYFAYLQIASSGTLGEKEQRRAEILVNSSFGPLAARSEFLINIGVIMDSPLIGKGYDPQIDKSLISDLATNLAIAGAPISRDYLNYFGVLHSFVLNAMVIGGIFAGFFWIYVLVLTGSAILRLKTIQFQGSDLLLIFNLGWATLFSPYAGGNRFLAMISIAYLVSALQGNRHEH